MHRDTARPICETRGAQVPRGVPPLVQVNGRKAQKRGTEFQSQCDYWPFEVLLRFLSPGWLNIINQMLVSQVGFGPVQI